MPAATLLWMHGSRRGTARRALPVPPDIPIYLRDKDRNAGCYLPANSACTERIATWEMDDGFFALTVTSAAATVASLAPLV